MIDVMWLLILAVLGIFMIELRHNYRLHQLIDARIEDLRLQPIQRHQHKAPFGKRNYD